MQIFSFFSQLTLSGVSLSPDEASTLVYLIITTLSIIFLALIAIIAVISRRKNTQNNTTNQPKQLTCRLCDNHQFTKIEDSIVCDNCGCKYSIDEAKDLLMNISIEEKEAPQPRKKKRGFIVFLSIALISIFVAFLIFIVPFPVIISNGYTYRKLPNGTYKILSYTKNEETVEIPDTIRNIEITEIEANAFRNNDNIKTIIVPQSIVLIGQSAFAGCDSIETMVLPFVGKSNTSDNRLSYIFNGNIPHSLKNIYLLDSCTTIGEQAFYSCDHIENIYIPSSVTNIADITNYTTIGVNGNSPESKFKQSPFYGCSKDLIIHCELPQKHDNWGTYWNFINKNYSVAVRWGVQLKDNYTLTIGKYSTEAIDHSIPKTITLTLANFSDYFTINTELSPAEYSMNLLNPGYKQAKIKIDIQPINSSYIFNNIQITISVNIHFNELQKSFFKKETVPVNGKDSRIIALDNYGNGNTIFTFFTTENGIIQNISEMTAQYQITHIYGELTPVN